MDIMLQEESKGKYIWAVFFDDGSDEEVHSNLETFEKFKAWWIKEKNYKFKSAIRRN